MRRRAQLQQTGAGRARQDVRGFQTARRQHIATAREEDVVPARNPESVVQSGKQTTARFANNHLEARIAPRILAENLTAQINGAVINADALPCVMGLRQERIETVAKPPSPVEHGNDDSKREGCTSLGEVPRPFRLSFS